jgi:hypothetical protein
MDAKKARTGVVPVRTRFVGLRVRRESDAGTIHRSAARNRGPQRAPIVRVLGVVEAVGTGWSHERSPGEGQHKLSRRTLADRIRCGASVEWREIPPRR